MSRLIHKSEELFSRAKKIIPGGVNSPVRAFTQVGGVPRFIERGDGAYVYDADGNKYIDFIGSWGPIILGHRSPVQLAAIDRIKDIGTSFGAPTSLEIEFAEIMCGLIQGLEMLRLVSSGTEATMTAARLARGYTGRNKIIKFNGCYHGHADSFLVQAGSGAATQGISGSLGVSNEVVSETISLEFNDIQLLEETLASVGGQNIACIIVEPVAGNMGLILPNDDFLPSLRKICDQHNIVLVFDEVMSGFRVSLKGASDYYSVIPDLYCFGKVIGGGLPMAAFGGRREIMECLAPLGGVYQAGTLSGNPVAVSIGIATLEYLIRENPYQVFESRTKRLVSGMKELAIINNIPLQVSQIGSMFGFFFSDTPVKNYSEAKSTNIERFKRFFHIMLDQGVYFAPSAYEAGFIGIAHKDELIEEVLEKVGRAFSELIH